MLDLKKVCDNIDSVEQALSKRSGNFPIKEVAALARLRRSTIIEVESKKALRNKVSGEIAVLKREKKDAENLIADMRALGDEIKNLDDTLAQTEEKLKELMFSIPNLPHESVPTGLDSDENREERKWGEPRKFDFEPKAHWDIGTSLGILDFEQAAKISGARFTVYHGFGAKLERAVVNFMLDTHAEAGYREVFPPYIVNRQSLIGTGQLPKFEDGLYALSGTDYYLIPTAEVPVTNLHRDEILDAERLPVKYCAYSACFRSEAGAAGRDTRGLIRQHQFNKVELVKFVHPSKSYDELEGLTRDAERILQLLNLPYRVVTLCSGDLGFCSAKTYDIEVYMPSYGRYVEISSCSNFEDFQARRAGIRFKENGKVSLLHTLNGSGLAVGRTVAAILENFQNADGSVAVPKALQKYIGTDIIK